MDMFKRVVVVAVGAIWAGVCIAALIEAYNGYSGVSDWRIEEGLAFEMMVLTFPASIVSYVALTLVAIILTVFGASLPSSRNEMIATWSVFFAVGCVQWFVVIPRIIKVMQRHRQNPA